MVPYQLALPVALQEKRTFEIFYPGLNQQLINYLKAVALGEETAAYLYIWGHYGVGCSHLLQACYYHAQAAGIRATYLSLSELKLNQRSPECLQDLLIAGEHELVCIDELDSIASEFAWEEALFYAYNTLVAQGASLVVAASNVPKGLNFKLVDLISRLNSGLLFQVHELNDLEKLEALQLRARLRGLILSRPVAEFLLSRWPRNLTALFSALNHLDNKALSHHRKLTIPFVKEVLSL